MQVRSLYTKLVPSAISHADFWQRYFYKIHQLEKDEERRAALKKRADASNHELEWDGDEEGATFACAFMVNRVLFFFLCITGDDWVDMSGPSSPPTDTHMPTNRSHHTDSSDSLADDRLSAEPVTGSSAASTDAEQVCDRVPTPESAAVSHDSSSDSSSIVVLRKEDANAAEDATLGSNNAQRKNSQPADGEAGKS